ncbi:MAG: flagellar basal body rod protein FlgC [Myxococcales bacterium]|nr:flagellar basal body rod protein FlgC [Myxococcales bacterium]
MGVNVTAIAASGLQAQRIRMQVISANLANIQTTHGPNGKPYQRQVPILTAVPVGNEFEVELDQQRKLYAVRVEQVKGADREPLWVYDPGHPDADEQGYVSMPNINLVEEMTDMLNAARSYEANLASLQTARNLDKQALDLGKS